MKSLITLIKLHKDKLDKILAELNKYEVEKANLEAKKILIQNEMSEESAKFNQNQQYAYMLDIYLQNARDIQKNIEVQIIQLNSTIILHRKKLNEQFTELKKFEITLQNRKLAELVKEKKLEMKLLDEYNNNKYFK